MQPCVLCPVVMFRLHTWLRMCPTHAALSLTARCALKTPVSHNKLMWNLSGGDGIIPRDPPPSLGDTVLLWAGRDVESSLVMADMSLFRPFPGEATVEELYDRMFTVTSRLRLTVSKEDDGVAVICIIDHPAVKDFQAQKHLEVQCESSQDEKTFSCKIVSV